MTSVRVAQAVTTVAINDTRPRITLSLGGAVNGAGSLQNAGRIVKVSASKTIAESSIVDAISGGALTIAATLTTDRALTLPDAAVTISAFSATLLDDADQASARTTLGVGTTDSPTFAGLLSPTLRATTSAGVSIQNASGSACILAGAGGGQGVSTLDGLTVGGALTATAGNTSLARTTIAGTDAGSVSASQVTIGGGVIRTAGAVNCAALAASADSSLLKPSTGNIGISIGDDTVSARWSWYFNDADGSIRWYASAPAADVFILHPSAFATVIGADPGSVSAGQTTIGGGVIRTAGDIYSNETLGFDVDSSRSGSCKSQYSASVAAAGTVDFTVPTATDGRGYNGLLIVSNTVSASANTRTQTAFILLGRATDATATSIATDDGSSGGASFSLSFPSNGTVRVTNTSGATTDIAVQFIGGTSL